MCPALLIALEDFIPHENSDDDLNTGEQSVYTWQCRAHHIIKLWLIELNQKCIVIVHCSLMERWGRPFIVRFHLPQIPEEMNRCRNSYVEQALLPRRLEDFESGEVRPGGYRAYLQDSLDALLKEAKDKFKGYDSCSTPEHAELSCRKVRTFFLYLFSQIFSAACELLWGQLVSQRMLSRRRITDQLSVCLQCVEEPPFIQHTSLFPDSISSLCHPKPFPPSLNINGKKVLRTSSVETHPCETGLALRCSFPSQYTGLCLEMTLAWHSHTHNLGLNPGLHFLCVPVCEEHVWGYSFSHLRVTRRWVCSLSSDWEWSSWLGFRALWGFFVVKLLLGCHV